MATSDAARYVLDLQEIDRAQTALVGGKGASLGELTHIAGVQVPPGLCVTTVAFRRAMADDPSLDGRIGRLGLLDADDRPAIGTAAADIRSVIRTIPLPADVAAAITAGISRLGDGVACAVRSSATAEDLPAASFAGQHDTALNVVGPAAILAHVRRCWGSLFTERAVTYRLRHGVDHGHVRMAVVVQQMVSPQAAGIVFTADPVTSNRRVVAVEATIGLGEALVAGLVDADVYKVRDGAIVERAVATKRLAIRPAPGGGTRREPLHLATQAQPALDDAQVVQLASLGRRIEAHFGCPQDIEWCLVDDGFQIVQSRPITTLFPIPVRDDAEHHVYVSVGHGQMMTDPMKPLGLSMWQHTARPPMHVAGGRLFVDVTQGLASPASRPSLLAAFGRGDPLVRDALETVLDRGDFVPIVDDAGPAGPPAGAPPGGTAPAGAPPAIETDPDIVRQLVARTEASVAAVARDIRARSGTDLLDFIVEDIKEMKRVLFDPLSQQVIMAGMEATWWLNDHLQEWLGEHNAADVLSRSAPGNITSQMGLDLLDVADVIRPHADVVELLAHVDDRDLPDGDAITRLEGGAEAGAAIRSFLDRYGMRGVGEIDITRPRWGERPTALVPVILGNVERFEPGEAERRVARGERDAWAEEGELLARLRRLPGGQQKADETEGIIRRLRTFTGYREHPKYGMICRYAIYKRALLEEADRLVRAQVLGGREDIFFLTLDELHDVVRTQQVDDHLIAQRKEAFESYRALTPPRVLTSDGEAVSGSYGRVDLPPGALVGAGVSAGTVEGRARVILDMAEADVEEGDILVTTHTDPSWSLLFVAVTALVTEVGGLMTHGAVIAREYGLPAVVGVEHATQLIEDGRRIRVHGTDGYVELLDGP